MLTQEENDLLCRVEGEAPMGRIMRSHWMPVCLSEEIPEADGDPVPVRLLGEDLVVWRDSQGAVGLMDRYCPHRRASLVFGRNEEQGLRCLYHGWKVDVTGKVVEMPSEPEAACAKKVRHKAYVTHEHGGFVWAWMGAEADMVGFEPPPWAPTQACQVSVAKIQIDCNWAQCLEGNIDSAHSSSLHSSEIRPGNVSRSAASVQGPTERPSTDKSPRIQIEATPYGFRYAALRRPIRDAVSNEYVRMTVFVAPFTVLIPPNSLYNVASLSVPIDDAHTSFYFIAWSDQPGKGMAQDDWRKRNCAQVGVDLDERFVKVRTQANRYLQDRGAMKNGSFTGIRGIPNQDIAMWETMGPIADRTRERLGSSDMAVVHFRNVMVEAARAKAGGSPAIGSSRPVRHADIRSFEGIVPKSVDWRSLARAEPSGCALST
ncbi:MAG: Rieske 2Fe-2S domain-containing protein [Pseudomonadota bacterium]